MTIKWLLKSPHPKNPCGQCGTVWVHQSPRISYNLIFGLNLHFGATALPESLSHDPDMHMVVYVNTPA